jgi:hypothetical protein
MVIYLVIIIIFEQIDQMSLMIVHFCFPSPKLPQLPSNLFISVVDDNGWLFFFFV